MKRTTAAFFLLELPLRIDTARARRLHAHQEPISPGKGDRKR